MIIWYNFKIHDEEWGKKTPNSVCKISFFPPKIVFFWKLIGFSERIPKRYRDRDTKVHSFENSIVYFTHTLTTDHLLQEWTQGNDYISPPLLWIFKMASYTGCPKKTLFLGLLAITPLWKGQEIKVRVFLKNSGNSLSDRHQNFSIWPIRSWENWVKRWQHYLKYLDKNGGIFSG